MNIQVIEEGGSIPCERCGCLGNCGCGHESPINNCALNELLLCPCCMADMALSVEGKWSQNEEDVL